MKFLRTINDLMTIKTEEVECPHILEKTSESEYESVLFYIYGKYLGQTHLMNFDILKRELMDLNQDLELLKNNKYFTDTIVFVLFKNIRDCQNNNVFINKCRKSLLLKNYKTNTLEYFYNKYPSRYLSTYSNSDLSQILEALNYE